MFKVTEQSMMEVLDGFMMPYDYPVYSAIFNMSSFFASRKNSSYGFLAVNDNGYLLVAEYSIFGEKGRYTVMFDNISKLKVKKVAFGRSCRINLEALCEGKKLRLEITIPLNSVGKRLNNQKQNAQLLIDALSRCSAFEGTNVL